MEEYRANEISRLQFLLILAFFLSAVGVGSVLTYLFVPLVPGLLFLGAITIGILALALGELRAPSRVALRDTRVEFVDRLGRRHAVGYNRLVSYRTYRMPGGQRVFIFFYRPVRWSIGLSPLTLREEIGRDLLEKAGIERVKPMM